MPNNDLKKWNRLDIGFYAKLLSIVIAIIILLFAAVKFIVYGYTQISDITNRTVEAKIVNDEMKALYDTSKKLGVFLIREQDLKRMQSRYDDLTIEMQKQVIIDAHTRLSQHTLPYGTWVYIKSLAKAVKVNSYNGYDIGTAEGIHFLLTDEDDYYTIDQHTYDLCKEVEKRQKYIKK